MESNFNPTTAIEDTHHVEEMEVNTVTLNDLIFNGLVWSVELNGHDDALINQTKMLHIPTSKQLNESILRLVNYLFPMEHTDEMVRYELKVSTNNVVSILSLQLAASSRFDRQKLLTDIVQGNSEVLTKNAVKSFEKLIEIQYQSEDSIEKCNLPYDQYVANFFHDHAPEVIGFLELKDHIFIDVKTDNQVYTIEQIIEPVLKRIYHHFYEFKANEPNSHMNFEEIQHQLNHLLSCALFVLWSKAHEEILEADLWAYWYRFVIVAGLVCVLLDAYSRRTTKKSAILNILTQKYQIELLSDVVATIDKDQMNEFSSEDMALVQSGFELHDDSPKHADTDMFLYQAMQDIYEVLKVISEENKLATLAYEEHVKKNPKKVDDKEGKASIAQNQEEIAENSITNKLYIVKCALAFQINRDNDDSRYDSFARLTVLHIFDLDTRDVGELILQQKEIPWPDKRITKSLIVNLLRNAGVEEVKVKGAASKQNVAQRNKKEWTVEDDMAAVNALEKLKITLVDLRRYFHYDDELVHILECKPCPSVVPNISTLVASDFPTFCNQKIWKLIQSQPDAKQALKIYHNHRGGWELFEVLCVKLVRLGYGKRGTGRIVAATDDRNTVRVLLHVGSHNSYMLYRSKAHAGVVAAYHASAEKRKQPNLTFVDYLRSRPNLFNINTRFMRN